MHIETVQFDLSEALYHLEDLVNEIRTGKLNSDDTPELAVHLAHIQHHLNRAWNRKDLSPEQTSQLTHEEFVRHSNTVPNYHGEIIIGDFAFS